VAGKVRRWPRKEFTKRTAWFREQFQLQDWTIDLVIQDAPMVEESTSSEMANVVSNGTAKTAWLWVSPSRCLAYKENQGEVLFHELLHMACVDVGIMGHDVDPGDTLMDRLAVLCERCYQEDRKKKKPPAV